MSIYLDYTLEPQAKNERTEKRQMPKKYFFQHRQADDPLCDSVYVLNEKYMRTEADDGNYWFAYLLHCDVGDTIEVTSEQNVSHITVKVLDAEEEINEGG